MIRRPPRSTRTDTLFPYTTLFRSLRADASRDRETGARSVRPFYPQGFIDAGATIPANDKEAALDRLPRYDVDAWGVSSTMNWDGGPVTVDRKRVVSGKSVSVSVGHGGRRNIKKKKYKK